jgi:predicted amidohydrolase YtcJ
VPGGRIEHDADGRPTGILLGRGAIDRVRHILPRPSFEDDKRTLHAFLERMAALGITALTEYASVDRETRFAEDWAVYEAVRAEGLPTRCRVAYRLNVGADVALAIEEMRSEGVEPRSGDDMLRAGPIKIFADGGVQGALLRGEYKTRPDYYGLRLVEVEDVARLSRFAYEGGWQLSIHVLGGKAIDDVLAAWATLHQEVGLNGRRFSLQHAFDPSPENMRVCRELGVVVGVQQSLFYMYGPEMERHWGDSAISNINPIRSWLDAGVQLAGGSDIPPHEPLTAMWGMCTRLTEDGAAIAPEEAVTAAEAFAIHTSGAAYGMFDEDLFGTIEVGKAADLVLLSRDPATAAADELREIEIVATLVDGEPTYASAAAPRALL